MATLTMSDGCELFYERRGEGRPVLLVHGWMGSHRLWEPTFADLMADHDVIALDLRGHGRSDRPLTRYSYERYAQDLKEVLDLLDLEGVVLVGWSMGCGVSMLYHHRFGPHRLAALALVAGSPKLVRDRAAGWVYGMAPEMHERILFEVRRSRPAYAKLLTDGIFHAGVPQPVRDLAFQTALEASLPCALESFEDGGRLDLREGLEAIRLPVSVFHGRTDFLASFAAAEVVARTIPGAELVAFDLSVHAPHWEEPERFHQGLRELIARI
jgi:pimeloyl-ACP methyl ester carboxylesterase